ncbi:hypothetical protein LIER_41229 [Lithospermum erythrorhizon]|uniref:SOUL heme-binding protein n=1 Tax=Lithospermum erythrorhizon TaxID=34254 RepID=A0AAV3R632_LITER
MNNNKDGGFSLLAAYIGVFGTPQNRTSSQIAMTAPVITKAEKDTISMQFILPEEYASNEEAPGPVDERVRVVEEGERRYGVVGFSGVASEEEVERKVRVLKGWLERDGFKVVGEFVLARFNPPWTLPMFRTNEVMIPVE